MKFALRPLELALVFALVSGLGGLALASEALEESDARKMDAPAPSAQPESPSSKDSNLKNKSVEAMYRLINRQRLLYGAPALKLNPLLMVTSQKHAENMARQGRMLHTLDNLSPFDRMNRSGYFFKLAAENLAKGQRSPHGTLKTWMGSRGHRQNLLNSSLKEIGLGMARDKKGFLYWVANFGTQAERGGTRAAAGVGPVVAVHKKEAEGKALKVWRIEPRVKAAPVASPIADKIIEEKADKPTIIALAAPVSRDAHSVAVPPLAEQLRERALGFLFSLTNDVREEARVSPFTLNDDLNLAAQNLADQMAGLRVPEPWEAGATNQEILLGAGYRSIKDARNSAINQPTPSAVLRFWTSIPRQRSNLLDPNLVELGQGVSRDSQGRLFWVQVYAQPGSGQ